MVIRNGHGHQHILTGSKHSERRFREISIKNFEMKVNQFRTAIRDVFQCRNQRRQVFIVVRDLKAIKWSIHVVELYGVRNRPHSHLSLQRSSPPPHRRCLSLYSSLPLLPRNLCLSPHPRKEFFPPLLMSILSTFSECVAETDKIISRPIESGLFNDAI